MDFFTAIKERHSFRGQFENTQIPESDLIKILDAGLRAPSGCNEQTTYFTIVTNKDLLGKIAKLFNSECVTTAPVIIVAHTKKVTFDFGLNFELEDYDAAIENILLAVTALGYASLWVDGSTRLEGKDAAIADILNIPSGQTVRTILPVGVPKGSGKQAPRKSFDDRVTWKK